MPTTLKLSKADAARGMVAFHFRQTDVPGAFERLRSVQFDPIAPVGCNHDLVLQSRVADYRIGDWQKVAYQERLVYDGWDKQASLVPMQGWPLRRAFHDWHRPNFGRIFREHAHAIEAVLAELEERGPLLPKEFEFQERKDEWAGSWFGPNVTKQTLRALWHSGLVMTAGRKGQHHVYDLTERIVPPDVFRTPKAPIDESVHGLVLERHKAVGLLRPTAPQEVWSFNKVSPVKKAAYERFASSGDLVPVDVEGMAFFASPEFVSCLDGPVENAVRFIAPLDQFMWDRKAVAHIFGFDYVWEIYVPEPKRKWGYYVLPVLHGDRLAGRVEFWCRNGLLEIKGWHWQDGHPTADFWPAFEAALTRFMSYSSATSISVDKSTDPSVRDAVTRLR
ncbi:MAG: YcaQ family DNA glycosylase [Armatimonadetes bacterium]|nr:YcaQ family DNA glycosylase [Armatimonadota bacterium]